VDIPTVSRWLGHKDGGALAMKVYAHLRDSHSTAMAQRIRFTENEESADQSTAERAVKTTAAGSGGFQDCAAIG
jgi:hypothetical protein